MITHTNLVLLASARYLSTFDKDSRIQGFKSIYLQQPIHFATVLINKTYSTITRQIEITNNHYNNQNYECVIAQYNLN